MLLLFLLQAALTVLFISANSSPVFNKFSSCEVRQTLATIPTPWVYQQLAPLDHILHLRIGLKLQNIAAFHQRVFDISTPGHPSYGLHLNREEVNAILKPDDDSATLVLEWLKSVAVVGVHDHQWVTANVTVAQAQELLQTKYNVYLNPVSHNMIIRTPSYSLPNILTGHVDLVQPTTMFGMAPRVSSIETRNSVSRFEKRTPASSSCAHTVTPDCIRALYNTDDYVPAATNVNSIGVVGFHDEFANNADLQIFYKQFRHDAEGSTYETIQVKRRENDEQKPGLGPNLGVQYTSAITYPTPVRFYSVSGFPSFKPDSDTPANTNEPLLELLNFMLDTTTKPKPQTLVIGYSENEQTVPEDYATTVCNLIAQLGVSGTTVIVASGDDGVGAGDCLTNDGTNRALFQPKFPASCPFVTAVGATTGIAPEVAASYSGGGFSRYFSQPDFQTRAISAYLARPNQYYGLFRPSGRAYPDVAALASGYQAVVDGKVVSVSESAAAAFAFASVISLLNDVRIAAGKPTLGFLNPLLYSSLAAGLNDITSGSNPGCGTSGFSARPGWDPVTGLGTPDFAKLKNLVLQ